MGTRNVTYKCPFCDKRFNRQDLVTHVEDEHDDMIPEGYTPLRLVFNYVNKKPLSYNGKCTECGGPTGWDETKARYNRQCGKKSCHDSYVKKFEQNMMRVKGVTRITATKEGLEEMLKSRKISGRYRFQNGVEKDYCGSYEKKALEFMDKVMNLNPDDILSPGPILEYTYEGKTHLYITDFYYQPYNLVIEVKDGGSNPNTRNMPEYRAKQIAKEKFIIKNTKFNYLRLTDNNFEQLFITFAKLRMEMNENTGERVIEVNESVNVYNNILNEWVVNKKVKESDISSVYFVFDDRKIANACVKIKGFKYPFRYRCTMLPVKKSGDKVLVYCKDISKDPNKHKYIFPGGGLDPNEKPEDAAKRECQEEAYINTKNIRAMGFMLEYSNKCAKWVRENIPKDKWWYGYYTRIFVGEFAGKFTGKVEAHDKDPVMASGDWYNFEEIKKDISQKNYVKAIEQYYNPVNESATIDTTPYIPNSIKNIIFDFGDVLVNFREDEAFDSFKELDNKTKERLRQCFHNFWDSTYDKEYKTYEEEVRALEEFLPEDIRQYSYTYTSLADFNTPYLYTDRLLSSLKNLGYKLYYLSNWTEGSFTYLQSKGLFDYMKYFDGGIVSYQVGLEKPDPEIYKLLIDKYNIIPDESIFFDDKDINIVTAKALGFNGLIWNEDLAYNLLNKIKPNPFNEMMNALTSGKVVGITDTIISNNLSNNVFYDDDDKFRKILDNYLVNDKEITDIDLLEDEYEKLKRGNGR